jgi:hypothetical protein
MPDEIKIYLKVNCGWVVSVDGYEEYDELADRATALEIAKRFGPDVREGAPMSRGPHGWDRGKT